MKMKITLITLGLFLITELAITQCSLWDGRTSWISSTVYYSVGSLPFGFSPEIATAANSWESNCWRLRAGFSPTLYSLHFLATFSALEFVSLEELYA